MTHPRKSTKILLVEDNPGDAYMVQACIDRRPTNLTFAATISVAESLADAGRMISEDPPDVILTDLGLPDGQGPEVFRSILKSAPTTPIIILSGNGDENMIQSLLKEGAVHYLPKGDLTTPSLMRAIRHGMRENPALTEAVVDPET